MSDIEKDTPSGVEEEPAERSEQDRELAERLVEQAKDEGLDLLRRVLFRLVLTAGVPVPACREGIPHHSYPPRLASKHPPSRWCRPTDCPDKLFRQPARPVLPRGLVPGVAHHLQQAPTSVLAVGCH